MDTLTKSTIIKMISEQLDKQEDLFIECRLKKSSKIIKLSLWVKEEEAFVDENGARWIRG